jgi:hypothetical protein
MWGRQYRSAIYTSSPAQLEAALASRGLFQDRLTAAGYGRVTTEISRRRRSSMPRTITSSTWRRIRTGTAGSADRRHLPIGVKA